MSCQSAFPKICGYSLPASIITLGTSNSLWSLHVESYSKDKFEKLVHLVGFIVRLNLNLICVSSQFVAQNLAAQLQNRTRTVSCVTQSSS